MDHQIPFCSSNSKTQRKPKTLTENSFFFIQMKLIRVKKFQLCKNTAGMHLVTRKNEMVMNGAGISNGFRV
jgi:hypothetical protein